MKAKKKPLETTTPAALGVDVAPRLATLQRRRAAEAQGRRQGGRRRGTGQQAPQRSQGVALNAMPTLVLAEHDNATLKSATLHAVAAASKLGDEVHVLVVGHNAMPVAEAARLLPAWSRCFVPMPRISRSPRRKTLRPRFSWCSRMANTRHRRGCDGLRQERAAESRGEAGRCADLGHHRHRIARHVRTADLRGQRVCHRAIDATP